MNGDAKTPDVQEYVAVLRRMLVLFERYNCALPKSMLEKMIARLRAGEPPSIIRDSNDIFGGMGSVSDWNLSEFAGPPPDQQAFQDNMELNRLLASLAERMCEDGLGSDRVRFVGAIRASWANNSAQAQRIWARPYRPASMRETIRNLFRGGRS